MSERLSFGHLGQLTLTATIMTTLSIASQPVAADDKEIITQLRQIIQQQMQEKGLPAISIALVRSNQVVWSEGFGTADSETGRKATAGTVYRVGSISKLLTDMAVMRQVERGRLDLDAPVQRYVPEIEGISDSLPGLTLRRLMSHRAGIVREPAVGHYFDDTLPTLAETVLSLKDSRPVYEPGTRTKYSNAAIAVVGRALEQATGQSFDEAIDQQMLKPLGMHGAAFDASQVPAESLARGLMWTYDDQEFAAPDFRLGTAPAGNLYASVLDLAELLKCVMNRGLTSRGRLLATSTLESMFEPQQDDGSPVNTFGLGFHLGQIEGKRRLGHGGAVYGFSTELAFLPDQQLGVAIACNLDMTNGVIERIADHALQLLLADQQSTTAADFPTSQPLPEGLSRTLHGVFESDAGKQITTLARGDRLRARIGSLIRELRVAGDSFVADDRFGYGPIVQRVSSNELVVGETHYLRRPEARPADPQDELQSVVGEYGWPHNTLFILEDQGRLVALIEWFFLYPLEQIEPNRFAFPDHGLYHGEEIVFERDAQDRLMGARTAGVWFPVRPLPDGGAESFRIELLKPIEELRRIAAEASPPLEQGEFRASELTELTRLDPSIKLDIRYAGTNNFMGAAFYQEPRAFLQKPAAEAVVRVHRKLREAGYGLLIHDAYRPWSVTKMFYDATPDSMKDFVANPRNGSRHNRGCAVDLTLYDLKSGEPIRMVSGYDEFTPRAFPDYPGGTTSQRWHRELLRRAMESEGFTVYEKEWWHFDYRDWRRYGIQNVVFDEIR